MSEPSPSPIPHFFHNLPRYPQVTEDGKIDTVQFLEASKAFIKIYGELYNNKNKGGAGCMTFQSREESS